MINLIAENQEETLGRFDLKSCILSPRLLQV